MKTSFKLNGKAVEWDLDPGTSLRDALRAVPPAALFARPGQGL